MASKSVKTVVSRSAGGSSVQQSILQTLTSPTPSFTSSPQTLTLKDLQEALKLQTREIEEQMSNKIDKMNNKMEQITEGMEAMSDEMGEIREIIKIKNKEIREDIIMAFQGLAKNLEKLDERLEEVNQSNLNLEDKMNDVQNRMEKIDEEVMMSQYRDMEFALRVRGMKENQQENLREVFAKAFASTMGWRYEEVIMELDKIFRVNSWIARQRQLPRDIVIYFSKRTTRNEIIQAFYNNRFQVEGQEVLILKEIPPKILRKRKEFAFLADELKKR